MFSYIHHNQCTEKAYIVACVSNDKLCGLKFLHRVADIHRDGRSVPVWKMQCRNWPKRTGTAAQGWKFKTDFHSKSTGCRRELRGGGELI